MKISDISNLQLIWHQLLYMNLPDEIIEIILNKLNEDDLITQLNVPEVFIFLLRNRHLKCAPL
jgi:hypothetical protein